MAAPHTLFDLLQDFGERHPAPASRAAEPAPVQAAFHQPQPNVADMVRSAVERAEAEVAERLALAHRSELEAEAHRHAEQIDALNVAFGKQAGEALAARIADVEARIVDLSASTAARILGSFLSDDLQKRSVDALAESIRFACADHDTVRVTVRGPQSLFESLRQALGERAGHLDFVEASGFDLTADVNGALFETRMSEWAGALGDILA